MKKEEFKKLIKESVKEAIKEELISSLLEVLSEQKTPISSNIEKVNLREEIRSKIPKPDFNFTTENIANLVNPNQPTLNSQQGYNPGVGVNTSGEGSSLPPGEVSMDQIANLMTSK
tara:strand:- start:806 stop:1153 length:348 start_codon:yes stop_codon:yes gene_type:complete